MPRSGDIVTVDIDERRLSVDLSDEVIAERIEAHRPSPRSEHRRDVVGKYAATAASASRGGVMGWPRRLASS